MSFYETLKFKLKRQKAPPKAYLIAVQTEQGRYRSLCGEYALRNNRPGWKANGFFLYLTKEAAHAAWQTDIDYKANGNVVIVLVEANYDLLDFERATAKIVKPIQSVASLNRR